MSVNLRPLVLGSLAGLAGLPAAQGASFPGSSYPAPSFDCGGPVAISWPQLQGLQPQSEYKFADGSTTTATNLECADLGAFAPLSVLARKSGEGQKDFLKITMKEVLVTSAAAGGDGSSTPLQAAEDLHIKLTTRSVFFKFDDSGQALYDTYFDWYHKLYALDDEDFSDPLGGGFIGHKWRSVGAFQGAAFAVFDEKLQTLSFNFELQEGGALLSLSALPGAVSAPGSLVLLGTGLAGLAGLGAAARRRRGW